jgi:hypothetical protein
VRPKRTSNSFAILARGDRDMPMTVSLSLHFKSAALNMRERILPNVAEGGAARRHKLGKLASSRAWVEHAPGIFNLGSRMNDASSSFTSRASTARWRIRSSLPRRRRFNMSNKETNESRSREMQRQRTMKRKLGTQNENQGHPRCWAGERSRTRGLGIR